MPRSDAPAKRRFAWAGLLALSGCGVEHLGVIEVEFALSPAPFLDLPSGVDGSSVSTSRGTVRADVVEGLGRVNVTGLPDLPAGLVYTVVAGLTHDERDALPGGEEAEGQGHAHGALQSTSRRSGPHSTGLHDVTLGDLERNLSSGQWLLYFSAEDTEGHPLGGLRSCQVLLGGTALPSPLLLSGSAGDDAAVDED